MKGSKRPSRRSIWGREAPIIDRRRAIGWLALLAGFLAADSWATKASMTMARHGTTSALACNAIFTIGGKSASANVATNEVYDPVPNSWRLRTEMPIARNGVSSGTVNNKIYVFGGTTNGSINYEYDPSSDTWTTKAPMPTARYEIASLVLNNKVYAIGGKIGSGVTGVVEIYDPATNTWSTGPSMPTPRAATCAAVVGTQIHVMGGYNAAMQFLNIHEVYDTMTHEWFNAPSMPTSRGCHVAAVIGPLIYAISGYNGSAHLSVNEVYDTENDTWQTKAPIPTPRKGAGCAVLNNKIYVIGGSNSIYLNVCEEYTPDIIGVGEGSGVELQDDRRIEAIMTSHGIFFTSAPANDQRSKIVLFDVTGRKVDEWERPLARNLILRPKAGSDFPKGIYFMTVCNEDLDIVKKLVCFR